MLSTPAWGFTGGEATVEMMLPVANAGPLESSESAIKAVSLFRILALVDLPPRAWRQDGELVIGTLGSSDTATSLRALSGRRLGDTAIKVVSMTSIDSTPVDVVFMCAGMVRNTNDRQRQLEEMESRSVLTISDHEGFVAAGGMIQLLVLRNRLHIGVGLAAIRDAGLAVRANLLRLRNVKVYE